MLDLNFLAKQIDEFIELSGDDVSGCVDYGDLITFSHESLFTQNFTYEINLYNSGKIDLVAQEPVSNKSFLNVDTESTSSETLMHEIIVRSATVSNIHEVIEFIYA